MEPVDDMCAAHFEIYIMQLRHDVCCSSIVLEAAVVFLSFKERNEFPYPCLLVMFFIYSLSVVKISIIDMPLCLYTHLSHTVMSVFAGLQESCGFSTHHTALFQL
jgi:hypothetical protein